MASLQMCGRSIAKPHHLKEGDGSSHSKPAGLFREKEPSPPSLWAFCLRHQRPTEVIGAEETPKRRVHGRKRWRASVRCAGPVSVEGLLQRAPTFAPAHGSAISNGSSDDRGRRVRVNAAAAADPGARQRESLINGQSPAQPRGASEPRSVACSVRTRVQILVSSAVGRASGACCRCAHEH